MRRSLSRCGAAFFAATVISALTNGKTVHDGVHEIIERINREIDAQADDAGLYLKRAELLRLHGDWDGALADLQHAQELRPKLSEIELVGARIYRDRGDLRTAKQWIEQRLGRKPDCHDSLLLHAELLAQLNQKREAIEAYSRAIANNPNPRPDHFLARARLAADLGSYPEAIHGLDQGIQRLGSAISLQLAAIEFATNQTEYDDALRRVREIAAKSPRKETWFAREGQILRAANRPEEALTAFRQARAAIDSLKPRYRFSSLVQKLRVSIVTNLEDLESTRELNSESPTKSNEHRKTE